MFIVDVTHLDDLKTVVQEAHVVINAVALHSHCVLQACVHHGRHCLDIMGDVSQLGDIIHGQDLVLSASVAN